jgi:WD40 repeat protein
VPREVLVALAFSPDGQFLAVADGPRRQPDSRVFHHYIRLFNLKTGRKIREFAGSPARAFGPLAFSPDGKTLAAAGYENRGIIINLGTKDNAIHLWEVATGAERLRLRGHTGRISHLRFAEHGRTLLSASEDTTVLAWDLTGGRR